MHGFSPKERDLELPEGATADDAPRACGIRPELVLVFRGDRPLPADAPLAEGDRLRILRVVSGGAGPAVRPQQVHRARARPLRVRTPALALLLLVAPLLAPLAAAEGHVYSHRFVIEGRLVGADGLPLAGREIAFAADGAGFEEPCEGEPVQNVTDEWGDFRFCFHEHALDPRTHVMVSYGNVTASKPMDTAFRRSIVLMREPNETGVAPEGWARTYRIAGKAWQAGVVELDGVRVFGRAVPDLPVNLTITGDDGENATYRTSTDAYGDFDFVVGIDAAPGNVTARIEALGRSQPVRLDPTFHRSTAPVFVPPEDRVVVEEGTGGPVNASFEPTTGPGPAPGSSTPRLHPMLVVGVVLALAGAVWLAKKSRR